MRYAAFVLLWLGVAAPAHADDADDEGPREMFRVDLGMTFSHFEQQVKTELGGTRGERIVEDTAFGLDAFGTWRFWEVFSVGLFTELDLGNRTGARFDSFAPDGEPLFTGRVGGSYTEFWMGPLVRAQWRGLFAEASWGPLAFRWDRGRPDLRNTAGEASGVFRTTPGVSWRFAIGGVIPVWRQLHVVLRLRYRIRYYVTRGGEDLENEMVHGTQDYTPFVGAAWRFDHPD